MSSTTATTPYTCDDAFDAELPAPSVLQCADCVASIEVPDGGPLGDVLAFLQRHAGCG